MMNGKLPALTGQEVIKCVGANCIGGHASAAKRTISSPRYADGRSTVVRWSCRRNDRTRDLLNKIGCVIVIWNSRAVSEPTFDLNNL